MTPGHDRGRPGQDAPAVTTTVAKSTSTEVVHGAVLAADAAQGWKMACLDHEIRSAAARREQFAADDIAARLTFACDGPWVGGAYMRLHREGVITRSGYRPSRKKSRAGGVVAVWAAGDAA